MLAEKATGAGDLSRTDHLPGVGDSDTEECNWCAVKRQSNHDKLPDFKSRMSFKASFFKDIPY